MVVFDPNRAAFVETGIPLDENLVVIAINNEGNVAEHGGIGDGDLVVVAIDGKRALNKERRGIEGKFITGPFDGFGEGGLESSAAGINAVHFNQHWLVSNEFFQLLFHCLLRMAGYGEVVMVVLRDKIIKDTVINDKYA